MPRTARPSPYAAPSAAVTNARSEHHHPPVAARIRSHVCGPADQPSVKPDTDSFHDPADTLDFVPKHAIKFLRAAAFRLNPNYRKLVDDIGLLHDCARLSGHFLHDCGRRALTSEETDIRCKVESRYQLGNGGHVRHQGRAVSAVAGEQLEMIGPGGPSQRRIAGKQHLDVAAQRG